MGGRCYGLIFSEVHSKMTKKIYEKEQQKFPTGKAYFLVTGLLLKQCLYAD